MSFEPLHTGNYEEAFLLYADGELDAAGRAAVEAFVAAHPELRAELDLYMETRLEPETVALPDKSFLMAGAMRNLAPDEDLLRYLDSELPEEAAARTAARIESDPDTAREAALLRAARLSPDEHIPFPWKDSLYRQTGRTVRMTPFYRAASAAAVFLLLASGAWWAIEQSAPDSLQSTAYNQKPEVGSGEPGALAPAVPQPAADAPSAAAPSTTDQPVNGSTDQPKATPPAVDRQPSAPSNVQVYAKRDAVAAELTAAAVPAVQQQHLAQENPVINKSVVTISTPAPLDNQNTAAEPAYAVQTPTADPEPAGRRGSLKGLLRKATRIIERRTGIETVNEDGELLIGVVAVKLD